MKCLVTLPLILLAAVALRAEPEYPEIGPDIYNPKADGFTLIAAALEKAKAENKMVLLDFGANWCPWCHKLYRTLTTTKILAEKLASSYVVVMIDVNTRKGMKRNAEVNTNYGDPTHEGLPALVVLDAGGNQLVTQETGALESGDHHDTAKVLAFLHKWAPRR
ncbi:MAG: thioredoxin family protein [Opitutaceae bacterium]|nr:thioredoxin family protein [Opitutaceae bacterium]